MRKERRPESAVIRGLIACALIIFVGILAACSADVQKAAQDAANRAAADAVKATARQIADAAAAAETEPQTQPIPECKSANLQITTDSNGALTVTPKVCYAHKGDPLAWSLPDASSAFSINFKHANGLLCPFVSDVCVINQRSSSPAPATTSNSVRAVKVANQPEIHRYRVTFGSECVDPHIIIMP